MDEARERARELLVRIGDGEDPAEDPAADRRRSRDVETSGRTTTDGTPEGAKSEVTPERLRAEAEALLEIAERQARGQEETRFAAIDLLKRADELESER